MHRASRLSSTYPAFSNTRRDAGFRGEDISRLVPHRRAALGIGRTFQGIQTYATMTARENILSGFHARMRTGFVGALCYWGPVRREEETFAAKSEAIIDFLELEDASRRKPGLFRGDREAVGLFVRVFLHRLPSWRVVDLVTARERIVFGRG